MHTLLAATQQPPAFDVDVTATKVGALLAVILGLVILVIAIKTAWANYGEGDVSKSASSLGVVAIAVIIAAFGAGGFALAYGTGLLRAITRLFVA